MTQCRICRSRPADSDEHLISSALGGRRKVRDVLCVSCNNTCGGAIDAELAQRYAEIRMALAIEGDRGQTAAVRALDSAGNRVILEPGMVPKTAPRKPEIVKKDGNTLSVVFSSERAARDYLASLERKNPGVEITITSVRRQQVFPGNVQLHLQLGGDGVMRSCVKSALVLVAMQRRPEEHLEQAWNYVESGGEKDNVRLNWTLAPAPFTLEPRLGLVPHLIAVVASRASQTIRMQARLFGGITYCGTLAADVDCGTWKAGYAVDPLSGEEMIVDDFEGEVGTPIDSASPEPLFEQMQAAMDTIMRLASEQAGEVLIDSITRRAVQKHLGGLPEGTPITDEVIQALAHDLAEEYVRHHFRENTEVEDPDLARKLQEMLGTSKT